MIPYSALIGGVAIGLAVTWMLLSLGRIAGISNIVLGALTRKDSSSWRYFFLFGLVAGGFILRLINPDFFENTTNRNLPTLIIAGLLVGLGTVLANGCTSGHGICGISRFSKRSIFATITFMFFGAVTVFMMARFL